MAFDKREVLGACIKAMLATLVLSFLFILFRSLGGPSNTSTNAASVFDSVVVGQTALRREGQERFWATRLNKFQRRQVSEISPWVIDAESGCQPDVVLCVVSALSQRNGIDIVYSTNAPSQLPKGFIWHGGFIDPATGAVFDFMGRAYKNIETDDQRISLKAKPAA